MENISPNNFSRNGAFYPIVLCYLHQLFGMKELAIQATYGEESAEAKMGRRPGRIKEAEIEALRKLCGPLQLRSEQHEKHFEVRTELLAKDTAVNLAYLASYSLISAGQVFIIAYELIKEAGSYEASPIFEFLRHCRNAAAHGGKFNLVAGEPHKKASWGRFEISGELNGSPLFLRPDGTGMLGLGDPVRLLWDIEQAYPKLGPSERVYGYLMEKAP